MKPVESSKGNYTKLKDGDTKLRILTSPILWWEYFSRENKPVRSRTEFESTPDLKDGWKVKQFRAMWVYNYEEDRIQVWSIPQNSIKKQLWDLTEDEDFGNPMDYDIKVNRSWKDLETTYQIKPLSKSNFDNIDIETQAKQINLDALFLNEDPFKDVEEIKPV